MVLGGGPVAVGEVQSEGQSFTIEPRQTTCWVGEPVVVRMTVTNATASETMLITLPVGVEAEVTSFFVAPPKGKFAYYDLGYVIEPSGSVELKPAGVLRKDQPLYFNAGTIGLKTPATGAYRIKATLHLFGVKEERDLDAPAVEVKVVEPPKEESKALGLFLLEDVGHLLTIGAETPRAIQALERLARDYPRSRYTLYARYFLARRAVEKDAATKADYRRAVELLKGLEEVAPPFQMAEDALVLLARSHLALGEKAAAREALEELLQRFAETASGDEARLLLKELRQ